MLDADLAELYGVKTFRLNEQVKRNADRFPPDFAFQLTQKEFRALISQIAISKGRGGRRKLPWVFTEHGALAVASVLNTPTANQVSVFVVRAFVRLRRLLASHEELARRVAKLEKSSKQHDVHFQAVFQVINQIVEGETKPKKPIGFTSGKDK